ncbi:hypothetical protein DFH06DRAFT_1170424 [Mycena polygramma]|nr:hypothetical protein DFH06DRAFT_1170424 [Mycena polygramma]
MGNTLTKSPQELTLATMLSTEKQRRLIHEPEPAVSLPPSPGYVRIHFHSHLHSIFDRSPPDMVADVPLCRSGGLDLDVVKRVWGLETCLPVDPLRWKPFEPTHSDYLSAVAVEILSYGQGCIKFIEPTVSHRTLMQRQTREVVLGVACLAQLACCRSVEMVAECLEADTPLPGWYRRLRRQSLKMPLNWEELSSLLILFLWIAFAVASFGGYIEWAPRERARKWVHTGSFSL